MPLRNPEYDISVSANGDTLWINDKTTCVGRFSKKFGMDIHRSLPEQERTGQQCLHCTHEPATPEDWRLFRQKIFAHYNLRIDPNLIQFEAEQGDGHEQCEDGTPTGIGEALQQEPTDPEDQARIP